MGNLLGLNKSLDAHQAAHQSESRNKDQLLSARGSAVQQLGSAHASHTSAQHTEASCRLARDLAHEEVAKSSSTSTSYAGLGVGSRMALDPSKKSFMATDPPASSKPADPGRSNSGPGLTH
jgi:hypothetical protein